MLVGRIPLQRFLLIEVTEHVNYGVTVSCLFCPIPFDWLDI